MEEQTLKQRRDELLVTSSEYLQRAIPSLRELADGFYKEPGPETWEQFQQFLQGFEWLQSMFGKIYQVQLQPANWHQYEELFSQMNLFLQRLSEALERKAHTEAADIIMYELHPQFELLHREIQKTIDNEVVRNDLN